MVDVFDEVVHCVVRICAIDSEGEESVGTGFIFAIHEIDGTHVPLLITNKHVIEDAKLITFRLSKQDENGNVIPNEFATFEIKVNYNIKNLWYFHPNSEIDLCAFPIGALLKSEKGLKWSRITKQNLPTYDELNSISTIDEVIMVGYPTGLWDSINNRPIFRKGIIATHPKFDLNGEQHFLIDIAAFQGSSGSPVFIYKEGFNVVNTVNTRLAGKDSKFYFIGVMYATPTIDIEGELIVSAIPAKVSRKVYSTIPLNLGFVINSKVIMDFEKVIINNGRQ